MPLFVIPTSPLLYLRLLWCMARRIYKKKKRKRTFDLEQSSIYTTLRVFKNRALFQLLGLPSRLTRHNNRALGKCSLNRSNLKTPAAFHFCVERKQLKRRAFTNRSRHDQPVFSPTNLFSNTNPK